MEELMPELVGMVLSQVDRINLVACRFVCATWMRITSPPPTRDADESKHFAANGWLGVLQWARANGCPWDRWTCANAATGGHLDVLQWVRANGCPWDKGTCMWAARGGHLEVLQWARSNG
jgi:hypothetical protein